MRVHIAKLQEYQNGHRIWLEGNWLAERGFETGASIKIDVDPEKKMLTCQRVELSDRAVSGRKKSNGGMKPIIEIKSARDLEIFEGMECVRVICDSNMIRILPIASESRRMAVLNELRQVILNGGVIDTASMFHGGGVLSEAVHEGINESGLKTESAVVVELRQDMMDISSQNSKHRSSKTVELVMPAQEMVFDEWVMSKIPRVAVLSAGIPCAGTSPAGRAKNKNSVPESHPHVGHMVVPLLGLIGRMAPPAVILECVPQYLNTASMEIIRLQLRDLGYDMYETVVHGAEWGHLEDRSRMCAVAVLKGIPLDWASYKPPENPKQQRIGDVLENIPDDDPVWKPMTYLREKEQRDIADGKGFKMNICTPFDTVVKTIGKGYAKVRSTEPKLQHPTNPELLRQFTSQEHCAFKGVSKELIRGDYSETFLHELLGQSVVVSPFKAIAKLIGEAFVKFAYADEIKPAGISMMACG